MNLITKIEVKYSKKIVNSFISGVLITIFSTPCTAPFLGIALGYAINENIFITFFTFVFIGLGFALPYIIVRLKPSLFFIFQKKYPKFIKIFYPIATISVIFIVIWLMYILTDYWSIEQIIIFLNLLLLLVYIYKADIKNISSFIFKLTIILVILFLPYQGIYNHLIKYLSLLSLLVLISYRILKNNNSNILFYKIFRSFIFITIVILTLISLLYYNNYYLYMILISLLLIVDNLKLNHITKILTVIFFLSLGLYMLVKDDSKKSIIYTSYSQVAIQENVKKGHIVILDITAKWCITCHANFITTFNSEDIKQYFMDNNIKFMRLDITKKNEEINELIKSKGKIGIPLTIIYSLKYPDGKVLNTLLYPEYLIQEIKLHF